MSDWNPTSYLQFEEGRNKPIFDLLCHINEANPLRIIDIGCGPGNSTAPLAAKYPYSEIIGIDSSPNMINKAQSAYPEIKWMVFDANNDFSDFGLFDIVFTNSTLHWLPNHNELLPRLFALLNPNGVFAAQISYFFGTPIYEPLYSLVKTPKWDKYISIKEPTTYNDLGFYYDILSSSFSTFDIWTTTHTHVLKSKKDIIEWYKTTGIKAFTDQIVSDEMKNEFLCDASQIVDQLYSPQKDGNYLLRFERLFFVAKRTV